MEKNCVPPPPSRGCLRKKGCPAIIVAFGKILTQGQLLVQKWSGTQRKEELFCLVRTMSSDRNCTDVQLVERSDLAALAAEIYSRHPEWLKPGGASGADRLRPQHYKANVRVSGLCIVDLVRAAIKEASSILAAHPLFPDSAEKFKIWEAQGITALEPHGEPLVTGDEVDPDDDEATANEDGGPLPSVTPTPCDSMEVYMNGGQLQYHGKDAHIMSVVNETFNKKRVRRSSDRLVRIEGGTANPNAMAECVETPLGETLWVGAPFIALINYQPGKRKTALKSTAWVFAVLEGLLHGKRVQEPTHIALNSAYGSVVGVPMRFRADDAAVLQYVSNVDQKVTFAYTDVHFINPECASDGTWSLTACGRSWHNC